MRQQPFASPQEALAHYGVKGMRWGVRKADETASKSGKVGVDPVTAALGAAYLAVILGGAYVTTRDLIRAHREGKIARDDAGDNYQKKNADVPWKVDPKLAKKMNVDELYDNVVRQVNPKFGGPGTKMNCRRCTFAYEMRRRGYDVKATPSVHATGQDVFGLQKATGGKKHESLWGEKQVATKETMANATAAERSRHIFSALGQHPEGARGELAVGWIMGGGHSMAWEIVGGKPIIFDTQTSQTYRNSESFERFSHTLYDAAHTRTDNIKLDEKFLKKWVQNHD